MKTLIYILALSSVLFASPDMSSMANVASCKKCHPIIADEFESSMHKKSSIYDDKVHKAIWDKHPAKAKGDYQRMNVVELLQEMKILLEHTELNKSVFRSDHASNYLVLKGILSRDKDKLLNLIKKAISEPNEARLRNEWQRGL